ncbi:MAG: anthranilate synthase component II [Actinomycetota bacterium]
MNQAVARILVLDNYDSFVFNLVQYLGQQVVEPLVARNDQISVREILAMKPDGILLSPGPGQPTDAGVMCELIRGCAGFSPIFGVCLGHQAIGHVFGAQIVRAPELRHGKTSEVSHDKNGVFKNIENLMVATRYHSLVIDSKSIPDQLAVTATTSDGVVMGVRHKKFSVEGVQFHPESVLTRQGHEMVGNFVEICKSGRSRI